MASMLAGCTATDIASDPGLSLAVNDLQLPDTVEVMPTPSGEPPLVVPVAYAGSTPETASSSAGLTAIAEASDETVEDTASEAQATATDQQPKSLLAAVRQDDESPDHTGSIATAQNGAATAEPQPVQTAAVPTSPKAPPEHRLLGEPRKVEARSAELDNLIARYAAYYDVPVALVRRVVDRESTFNPAARNGPYWGLMQIRHDTARTMGYRGTAEGLLDAETNLRYAVRYLRGAYITAGGNHDRAVRHYAAGYYYHARDKGLLKVTGLR